MEFQENKHFKKEQLVNREITLSSSQGNGQGKLLCDITIHWNFDEGNHLLFSAC